MNCPVCNKEMGYKDWREEGYIVEHRYECLDGCYVEVFSYGNTEIHIAGVMLGYYYNTPENELKYIERQISMLAELEREYRANGSKLM